MKLENQVVSLELAKKLKELGVKQKSVFWWFQSTQTAFPDPWIIFEPVPCSIREQDGEKVAAFTVAELGEMFMHGQVGEGRYYVAQTGKQLYLRQVSNQYERWSMRIEDTEADARAKVLIYLIENNLITV